MVDWILVRVVLGGLCLSSLSACDGGESAAEQRSASGAGGGGSDTRGAAGAAGRTDASSGTSGFASAYGVDAGAAGTTSGTSGVSSGTSGVSGAATVGNECGTQARGLLVLPAWDALGYAPYALADCRLAYVAPDGALWLRDLASGSEQLLDASDRTPRRPSLSGDTVTWEVLIEGKSQVRVLHGGRTTTLAGDFDHASEPRAAPGIVAFTAWAEESLSSDTDVFTYGIAAGVLERAIGGSGQQRFPDVSPDHIAASDFSEDPRGIFDEAGSLSDLVVLERSSGKLLRRPRGQTGLSAPRERRSARLPRMGRRTSRAEVQRLFAASRAGRERSGK